MNRPTPLLPERVAALQAIADLERGLAVTALALLRDTMKRRKPPTKGDDRRSANIVGLRAHIELAIVELEHGYQTAALQALRHGLESYDPVASAGEVPGGHRISISTKSVVCKAQLTPRFEPILACSRGNMRK